MAFKTPRAALRQINRLFESGTVTGLSDAQLLERFVAGHDAAAFEALVARHGPMVLSVCRGVLNETHDAEDAFQATFLILVKKASAFRGQGQVALAGWLYLVAHRVALRANNAAARRRAHERRAGQMAAAARASGPAVQDELLRALREEIARLPEKLREAIVLCDLQGVPQERAAAELRLSERTLRRRLSEGRKRLKARLGPRAMAQEGGTPVVALVREARTGVPSGWGAATVQAALATVNHTTTAGAVSAVARDLSEEVLKIMMLTKLKVTSLALVGAGLMAYGAAMIPRGDDSRKVPPTSIAVVSRTAPTSASKPVPQADPLDAVGKFPVRGRVLDPDGTPVAHAEISIRHHTEFGSTPISPDVGGQVGRVAMSDTNGRFQIELDKGSSNWPYGDLPSWHKALIAATAPGFGLAWIEAGSLANGGEATLRLVRDDVPIHGRVLDTEGRPVAGVAVRLGRVRAVKDGVDLDGMLASGAVEEAAMSASYGYDEAVWPGGQNTWRSDADGRFEIRGVGRDRLGLLFFHGPAVANTRLYVMARAVKTPAASRPGPNQSPSMAAFDATRRLPVLGPRLVAATFEHVADRTKPILGIVRFKGTGKPAAGVIVHGYESTTGTSASARADAEGRFRLVGLPKAQSYSVYAWCRTGLDPFLGARISRTDTEGLKPIEATLDLPRGVIVTGRILDGATGRVVPAGMVQYKKLPTNLNDEGDRRVAQPARLSLTEPAFRITVPPGPGMFYASPRGQGTLYARARLSTADRGKGVGGVGDGEAYEVPLQAFHAYKIVDVPDNAEPFTVGLKVTRGLNHTGKVVGPDGRPVTGAHCYGLLARGDARKLADDTFEVLGLEANYPRELVFTHPESGLVGSVMLKGDDRRNDAPIEVRLDRAGTVKGRLMDEDGLPLSGARLSIVSVGIDGLVLPTDALWPAGSSFDAGADGRFQIYGLMPGHRSHITVHRKTRPNYRVDTGGVLFNLVPRHPGEIRDLGDVKVTEKPQ